MIYTFLDQAFPLDDPPPFGACDARCALCGSYTQEGHQLKVKSATSEVTDLFRYPSEWLCPPCARLYANSGLKGNLLALPDRGIRPFVARASATEERPMWRDLIMPRQTALVWRATGEGNIEEVARLLEGIAAVGKKRSIGYGVVKSWEIAPIPEFSLYDAGG